jgi:hypothetical protein
MCMSIAKNIFHSSRFSLYFVFKYQNKKGEKPASHLLIHDKDEKILSTSYFVLIDNDNLHQCDKRKKINSLYFFFQCDVSSQQ